MSTHARMIGINPRSLGCITFQTSVLRSRQAFCLILQLDLLERRFSNSAGNFPSGLQMKLQPEVEIAGGCFPDRRKLSSFTTCTRPDVLCTSMSVDGTPGNPMIQECPLHERDLIVLVRRFGEEVWRLFDRRWLAPDK